MRNKQYRHKLQIFPHILIILAICLCSSAMGASRNLLPRFPEIVLEKGFSENFLVTECLAKARIHKDEAQASINLTLQNRSDKTIKSSVKFRILYPTSSNQVRIKVNGKSVNYNRESPRHSFELAKDASISFQISAKININYSIDGVREALRKEHEAEAKKKGKKFSLDGFMKFFDRENFGKRFLIGPIASKWGVFPLDFTKVQLEVIVPSDFAIVAQESDKWQSKTGSNESTYTFSHKDGFAGVVFLPETDKKEFIKTQKILNSSEFMH